MTKLNKENEEWLINQSGTGMQYDINPYCVEEKLLEMQTKLEQSENQRINAGKKNVELISELAKVTKERDELKCELEKESVRKIYAYRREDELTETIKELNRQRFRNYNDEEYIIFLDDGFDFPESMSAPVVMSSDKFRELFSARKRLDDLAEHDRQVKIDLLNEIREPFYQKHAELAISYGIDGSTCKSVTVFLDEHIEQLKGGE